MRYSLTGLFWRISYDRHVFPLLGQGWIIYRHGAFDGIDAVCILPGSGRLFSEEGALRMPVSFQLPDDAP